MTYIDQVMEMTDYPKRMKIRWRWDGDDGDFITYQNPATGAISILNPVAAQIFSRCEGDKTIATIAEEICQEFDAPDPKQVTSDVSEFLTFMCEMGAVKILQG